MPSSGHPSPPYSAEYLVHEICLKQLNGQLAADIFLRPYDLFNAVKSIKLCPVVKLGR